MTSLGYTVRLSQKEGREKMRRSRRRRRRN
jgi:hypothetical protein